MDWSKYIGVSGESAEFGSQYRQMLDQATRTAQSARNLHRRWKDEGRTANVKQGYVRVPA